MKRTIENIDHQIQLKRDEIERYTQLLNPKYPPKSENPKVKALRQQYLEKLQSELTALLELKSS